MRDYGMDLGLALPGLSWRWFLVLLRHLSPFGAVAQALESAPREPAEDTREQADAFFAGLRSL